MSIDTADPYPWKEPRRPGRGAFIVVEGLDRAGKTTQVKKLCDRLYAKGHNVKTLRFPGTNPNCCLCNPKAVGGTWLTVCIDRTSPIGKMIDSYLQSKTEMDDHAIHLLFSSNRWEKA
jgi:dTMP kinase